MHLFKFVALTIHSYMACMHVQWNLSIAATIGEQHFGCYIGVAFIEGLFCTQTVHLGPGFLAVIQRCLYSGVAVKRDSTVVPWYHGHVLDFSDRRVQDGTAEWW